MSFGKITAIVALTVIVVAGPAIAEENKADAKTAASVANEAIAELAALENSEARTTLEKNRGKFGKTPEFKTAWALLEIQEAAGGDASKAGKALDSLGQTTKNQDISALASYWQGEIYYQQKQRKQADTAWKTAVDQAEKAVKKDPKDATAQFYYGASLLRTKKFTEARKALELAEENGFDKAMVSHQTGLSFLFQEKWSEAKKAFNQGLKIEPRYAPMYFWRAMAWDKLGRKDNMLVDLDQYLKLAPNGPDAAKAEAVLKSAGR